MKKFDHKKCDKLMCEEKPDVFVKTREGTVVLKELIEVLSKLKPCPAF